MSLWHFVLGRVQIVFFTFCNIKTFFCQQCAGNFFAHESGRLHLQNDRCIEEILQHIENILFLQECFFLERDMSCKTMSKHHQKHLQKNVCYNVVGCGA